jgi:hypothetical protein
MGGSGKPVKSRVEANYETLDPFLRRLIDSAIGCVGQFFTAASFPALESTCFEARRFPICPYFSLS